MTYKPYTGVGSRGISHSEKVLIQQISSYLDRYGFTLRSGHADGADAAFESYATLPEIYVPWKGFKNSGGSNDSEIVLPMKKETEVIASRIHPAWDKCSQGAKKLHQRNVHQVLGKDLTVPSLFLLACSDSDKKGNAKGGTATAWNLAKEYNIPCFNLRGRTEQDFHIFLEEIGYGD